MISGPENLQPRPTPSNKQRGTLRSQKRPLLERILLKNTFTLHPPQANANWKRLKQLQHKSTYKAPIDSRTQDWTTLDLTEKESQKVSQHYPHLTMTKLNRMSRVLNATPEELLQDAAKTAHKYRKRSSSKATELRKTLKKSATPIPQPTERISTPLLITLLVLGFLLYTRVYARVASCMEEPANISFFSYFNNTPQTFTECLLQI